MTRWIPVWVLPALVVFSVATVWLRLHMVRTTLSITQTDRMITNLLQERERVGLKVSALRSPRRLEVLARSRFNLNQPKAEQVVYLK